MEHICIPHLSGICVKVNNTWKASLQNSFLDLWRAFHGRLQLTYYPFLYIKQHYYMYIHKELDSPTRIKHVRDKRGTPLARPLATCQLKIQWYMKHLIIIWWFSSYTLEEIEVKKCVRCSIKESKYHLHNQMPRVKW